MPDRFQAEIDRIVMEHGLAGTDDYLNQWHWTAKLDRPGDLAEILDALIQELEADWDSGGSE
jgi:Virulence factor